MDAILTSIKRLFEMVHARGMRLGIEERLRTVLEASQTKGILNANFTIITKLMDDLTTL